jgi:predicted acylesterase/phospholipase RssA
MKRSKSICAVLLLAACHCPLTPVALYDLSHPTREDVEPNPNSAERQSAQYTIPETQFQQTLYGQLQLQAASLGVPPRGRETSPLSAILLSGGGPKGAFGAGILHEWIQLHAKGASSPVLPDHPNLVTGVSTGALLCTAAWIGTLDNNTARDKALQMLEDFRQVSDDDIVKKHNVLKGAINGTGLSNMNPLMARLLQVFDDDVFVAIAQRLNEPDNLGLFVGTVNFDTGKFVVWNMTMIARDIVALAKPNREKADELKSLYCKVLVASCSSPGINEPVFINRQMHMDGGVRKEVFLPAAVLGAQQALKKARVCLIYNGVLCDTHAVHGECSKLGQDPGTLQIALRAVDLLFAEAVRGSLAEIDYVLKTPLVGGARAKAGDYVETFLASLPVSLAAPDPDKRGWFPNDYMRQLFEYGQPFAGSEELWEVNELNPTKIRVCQGRE